MDDDHTTGVGANPVGADDPRVVHGFHDPEQLASRLDRRGRFVDEHLKPSSAR
ncbi:hypothetical protein [Rubrivivax albus]|uniref:hypothetical protein n=1 Tax=Rubrivivax albus TaxID=2499835 RepID=UPI0013051349|nr:hypothetical protein [Rubrivivax albus]